MSDRRREVGQAMAEYALLAALFFTLLIFILDGSRILWGYVATSHLATVGARYAIVRGALAEPPAVRVGPANYEALKKAVIESAWGLDRSQVAVEAKWEDESNAPGKMVTVVVTYRIGSVTNLLWAGRTLTLVGRASMIIQN
ncbi:MAG: TadE/TadG family type IV pilus assembly protein [Anaerolineae bacterium]